LFHKAQKQQFSLKARQNLTELRMICTTAGQCVIMFRSAE